MAHHYRTAEMPSGLFVELAVGRRRETVRLRLAGQDVRRAFRGLGRWLFSYDFDPDYVRRHTGAR
jgi:hypothetical protein